MRMKTPPHPGRIVRQECLEPLGLTVTEAARVLGVNRNTLNNLVNEKAGISPEMAVRLSKAFGSTPRTWLSLQMEHDLARAEAAADSIDIAPVARPDAEAAESGQRDPGRT
ncbi:addiction module antidote protein, HigA family [Limimonas halophila]|uniref:Addiction module antidote protein, HigA family n=1 Tax=Limimonas halophila TaxID=1082479 RepID=A0A1G7QM75_9PROT|nr:HigA family addiction module antitoxin [Limimonas halophila]SDF98730.1 addiction module antidote protein, HigA family [Limimonas halophila]